MSGDAQLEASYGYHVRSTHRAFDRLLQRRLARNGIRSGYWYFLRSLWQRDGVTQRELCREINLMESSAVGILNQMEAAGLIRKQRDADDRRKVLIFLTPAARRLKAKLLPYAREINAIASAGIPASELAVFIRVAERMKANLLAADSGD